MKYKVSGTVPMNFDVIVTADTEDEAEQFAKDCVEDGTIEFSETADEADINCVTPLPDK